MRTIMPSPTRLSAPFDGYVLKIHYDAGDRRGEPACPWSLIIAPSAPEGRDNCSGREFIRGDEVPETCRFAVPEIYPTGVSR